MDPASTSDLMMVGLFGVSAIHTVGMTKAEEGFSFALHATAAIIFAAWALFYALA